MQFMNFWDDAKIVEFEKSLTSEQIVKFAPYMTMFHVLKLEYKRLKNKHLYTIEVG